MGVGGGQYFLSNRHALAMSALESLIWPSALCEMERSMYAGPSGFLLMATV